MQPDTMIDQSFEGEYKKHYSPYEGMPYETVNDLISWRMEWDQHLVMEMIQWVRCQLFGIVLPVI